MQFKALALALFAAVAVSADTDSIQDLASQVPPCARSCIASFQIGCSTGDLIKAAFVCVQGACGSDDLEKTTTITGDLCIALAGQGGVGLVPSSAVPSAAETETASAIPTGTAAEAEVAAAAAAAGAAGRNSAAADVVGGILGAAVAVAFAL
ncbi:hypothetical protein F4809DRAFT_642596 [Biscogniauxia mediterranea]|nr:hypothetical protein F4809DRAFT_642596 [Biscogniauxia mediterranea]